MTWYSLLLFVHIVAVLAISAAALSLEWLGLGKLRKSRDQARSGIDLGPALSVIVLASLLVWLFSGVCLTVQLSGMEFYMDKGCRRRHGSCGSPGRHYG